ncbi:hypothetical protein [Halomicrobium salinisoli]|uniref:hypothetical protein n=1 Tax=Halomicrobium salinisoli TaxID=2878391 RepID=UPI001CEFD927|nr:hypothetical protein [Halomicrobium salinisoli]
MARVTKAATVAATLVAVLLVFVPALYPVSHSQALSNVLVGQFAAMAVGHCAYRVAYGKRPALRSAVAAVVCGGFIAISPVLFGLVEPFTTITMVGGALVAIAGALAVVRAVTWDEGRDIHDLSAGREEATESAEPA